MAASVSISRPFLCRICGKSVHSVSALQQHTRVHRSSFPYECCLCSESFRLHSQLKNHQNVHTVKPFICNWCGASFVEQYQFGQHLYRLHRIIANGLSVKSPKQSSVDLRNIPEKLTNAISQLENNNCIVKTDAISDETLVLEDVPNPTISDTPIMKTDLEIVNGIVNFEDNSTLQTDDLHPMDAFQVEAASILDSMDQLQEVNSEFKPEVGDSETLIGASNGQQSLIDCKMGSLSFEKVEIPLTVEFQTLVTEPQPLDSKVGVIKALTPLREIMAVSKEEELLSSQETVLLEMGAPLEKQLRFNPKSVMIMDDDSCMGSTLTDNSRFMLRGDPSLTRCQSGEDLFSFGSIMFADEKDPEIGGKSKDMSLNRSEWSSANLSALHIQVTPHKLSVDPGAGSVNVSPASSPFRAMIGQGDESDSELLGVQALKSERDNSDKPAALDKESSVSPGHTDPDIQLPLGDNSISFQRSFEDFASFNKKKTGIKAPKRRKSEPANSTKRRKKSNDGLNDDITKKRRKRTKSASSRIKTGGYFNGDFDWSQSDTEDYDYKQYTSKRGRSPIDYRGYKDDDDWNPPGTEESLQNGDKGVKLGGKGGKTGGKGGKSGGKGVKWGGKGGKTGGKGGKTGGKGGKTGGKGGKTGSKGGKPGAKGGKTGGKGGKSGVKGGKRSRTKKVQEETNDSDASSALEYHLRPKRRKNFQALLHKSCDCCNHNPTLRIPTLKIFNVQGYADNVSKLEKLRQQVTKLIQTVFPDVPLPPRFVNSGLAVEYLTNEVTEAASEKQWRNKQKLTPFGSLDGEVKVVLCKHPYGCLRHFRRKISRLLTTLLPDVNSNELESSGPSVDAMLKQVLETNLAA